MSDDIPIKDKKEWENFITSKEKLHNKDELTLNKNLKKITKKLKILTYYSQILDLTKYILIMI